MRARARREREGGAPKSCPPSLLHVNSRVAAVAQLDGLVDAGGRAGGDGRPEGALVGGCVGERGIDNG